MTYLLVLVYIPIKRRIQVLVTEIGIDKVTCIHLLPCTLPKKPKLELTETLKISNHVKLNIETFNDRIKSKNLSDIANSFKNHPLLFLLKWKTVLVLVSTHIERMIQDLVAEVHINKLPGIALFYCTLSKERKQELAWTRKISNHV